MNPLTGRTAGTYRLVCRPRERDGALIVYMHDVAKHCPHADRMRLSRVPKWVRFRINDAFAAYKSDPSKFDLSDPDTVAKLKGMPGYDGHKTPTQQRLMRRRLRLRPHPEFVALRQLVTRESLLDKFPAAPQRPQTP